MKPNPIQNFELFPDQASSIAPHVDAVFLYIAGITVFFTTLIFVLVVFLALYYRRRHPNERPPVTIPDMRLEVAWSVIPLLLCLVMFVWGSKVFLMAQIAPKDATEIDVIGKQWMWKVQHREGRREINELHVPIGVPIKLTMTSQDVIHDFGLPAFRLKMDVRPGQYSTESFTPTKEGVYRLFCNQYCGAQHAGMIGLVYVMQPEQYQTWLAGSVSDVPPRVAGERLFSEYGCAACHGQRAPTLAGLYGRTVRVYDAADNQMKDVVADDGYIRESILYPAAKLVEGYGNLMPSFHGQLSEEQLIDLVAYIKSLSGAANTGEYKGTDSGPATQPTSAPSPIYNPPAASYRANQ